MTIRRSIAHLGKQEINEVARLALGDPRIIPLWYGESDLVTPDFIRDAAKTALDQGRTFYDHAHGAPPLRQALQAYLAKVHGVNIGLERIIVPGAAMLAISMTVTMLVEPGDNVVVVSPVWPNIVLAIEARGAQARQIRLDEANGVWSLDLSKIEAAIDQRTRAIFVNSPNNPTGWMMPRAQQAALLDLARARGIALIADEVYTRIVYEGTAAPSFLEIADAEDDVFVINSFSKAWAMTGWRIGWLVAPARFSEAIYTLSAIENTGATVFAQYGAATALAQGEEFVAKMVARCRQGREIVHAHLGQLPHVRLIEPAGAFYAFFSVDGLKDPLAFAKSLVERIGVGLAPGTAFGPNNTSFLRLCFAQSPERLEQALVRLAGALDLAVTS